MRRRWSAHLFILRPVFQRVAHVIARASYQPLRAASAAIFCLGLLAFGVAGLTKVHTALGTAARAQATAGGTPTIIPFDAPGAGTGALQGTLAASINTEGDIAGVYLTAPNVAHGFLRSASTGAITEFDAPDAGAGLNQGTFAVSIDAAGDIAGTYADTNNAYHGFVRSASTGAITEFDAPGAPTSTKNRGTIPLSINTGGDITGLITEVNAVGHGFVRTVANGTATFTTFDVTAAGTGAAEPTTPTNIDASGNITGFYKDANGLLHGFLRAANGTITAPIDAPGASTIAVGKGFTFAGTLAVGLDATGDTAGIYADSNEVFHGFVRAANGTTTTFDVTGAGTAGVFPGTLPTSINGAGDITGTYADANEVHHGFLRTSNGTITAPLDAPGASTTGMFAGTVPFSINSADDLTGTYTDSNGSFHGFVLTAASAATPTFSPASGTYSSAQTVTISDATTGATIYYTTDGTTPTTASTQYTGAIAVDSTETIEAIAVASGFSNSPVATATYTISTTPLAATPTFSPAAGTYNSAQTVAISDATTGATIYYTTNGSTPTTSSTVYTGPINVSSTETIEAIAAATGFSDSTVATAAYTINAPAPDFTVSVSPTALTIVAGQSGQATFTVTPENGFNSAVSLACSGLPSGAACTFNPTSVTPNGAPATSTLTVSSTAASAALQPPTPSSQRLAYAFVFPMLALLFGIAAHRRQMLPGLSLMALLVVASWLTSCNSSGTKGGNTGTPVGTSKASVTASVGGVGAINHSATLTITITH